MTERRRKTKKHNIDSRLAAADGRPAGFDYLRLILAISVIGMHSTIVAAGWQAEFDLWASWARPFLRSILPMFFALSGFLVAGSFERSGTVAMFFGLRVIRIYPALVMEVLLSGLLLGSLFTVLPLKEYFAHPTFHTYLLNMLGEPHYKLPGVFARNPYPEQVNGQLWTVPYELACYATLAIISVLGGRRRRWISLVAAVAATIAYAVGRQIKYHGEIPYNLGPVGGPLLVICFLIGVDLYSYRDWVWMRAPLGLASIAMGAALVSWIPGGELFAPWPIAYATVYLGTWNLKRLAILAGADYSYGLFLYGYPIQQALVALFPGQSVVFNAIGANLVAGGFAAISWHMIEKPALKLRGPIKRWEDRHLASRQQKREDAGLAPRPLQ